MNAKEAAEFLDLIADRAQALYERGVRRVELGEVAFTLVGPEPVVPQATASPDDDPPPDALHDQWTYGSPPAGAPRRIPRRTRTPLVDPSEPR
jgi:hypothetical protein